jgi:uncharacterized protein YbbC (DUF1343 family)
MPSFLIFFYLIISLFVERASTSNSVVFGNQVLRDDKFKPILNSRLAILTNPTGVFYDDMQSIVDVIDQVEHVDLVAVFSPEHGFRGEKQAETGDSIFYIDPYTELPCFSAYNMTVSEMSTVLIKMNITTLLVDMQDVGVRLYTFVWTMYDMMAAVADVAAKTGRYITIIITDRPNPLGGIVDGPILNMTCCKSGYGKFPITHIHGMTIGELALMFNNDMKIPDEYLQVIKMRNWKRSMGWPSEFPWIPPSPNVPTLMSAQAYGTY